VCVGGLVFAALPVRHLALGLPYIGSLPGDNSIRQAAVQAQTGFAPGILSPTEILVRTNGMTPNSPALTRLEQSLAKQPGVAGVLGPSDQTIEPQRNLFLTSDGTAARYLVILSDDPLDARGIATLDRSRRGCPDCCATRDCPTPTRARAETRPSPGTSSTRQRTTWAASQAWHWR
jgi:putative drug exporter of the RND superfamily